MNELDNAGAQILSPAQRLEETRARLRKSWLREETNEQAHRIDDGDSMLHRFTDLVTGMWEQHPLKSRVRAASSIAGPALRAALAPVARSHPLRLIALFAGVGAVVVWVKPWRLLSRATISSVLISAFLPRAAIARWWASGQWLDLLQSDRLQGWFADRADLRASAPVRARSASQVPRSRGSFESVRAPTSYAKPAPSPITATTTIP